MDLQLWARVLAPLRSWPARMYGDRKGDEISNAGREAAEVTKPGAEVSKQHAGAQLAVRSVPLLASELGARLGRIAMALESPTCRRARHIQRQEACRATAQPAAATHPPLFLPHVRTHPAARAYTLLLLLV